MRGGSDPYRTHLLRSWLIHKESAIFKWFRGAGDPVAAGGIGFSRSV